MRHLFTRVWLSGLLLAFVVMVGCRGGSNDMPITITGITPSAAPQGSTATFGATVTGGTPPYTYSWTFIDIGTADSTTSATPHVLITGDVGTETVALVVTDSASALGLGSVPFDITDDAVTAVAPSDAGLPLGQATFEATTTVSPDGLEWDFGTGAEPSTSTDRLPEVVLQNPGTYQGTVTATFGGIEMPAFPFDYTVAEPVAPNWRMTSLGTATSGQDGAVNLIVHEDRLAVVYNSGGNLIFARAKLANPQSVLDWDQHIIGPGFLGGHHCVLSVDGVVAVAYFERNTLGTELNHGKFALSTVTEPSSAADWITYNVASGELPSEGLALAEWQDRLVLAGIAVPGEFAIGISDDLQPESDSEWTVHGIDKQGEGQTGGFDWPNLIVVDGDLYLLVHEFSEFPPKIRLMRATAVPPTDSDDWELLGPPVPNGRSNGNQRWYDLGLWNEKLVVATAFGDFDEGTIDLSYTGTLPPATSGDWSNIRLAQLVNSPEYTLIWVPLSAGRPAIVSSNKKDGTLRVTRLIGTNPEVPLEWTDSIVTFGVSEPTQVSGTSLDDRLALAFVSGGSVSIAIAQGPY